MDVSDESLIETDKFHLPLNINLNLYLDVIENQTQVSFDYKNADCGAIKCEKLIGMTYLSTVRMLML